MGAKSEAQRRYLAATFGVGWMSRHHYLNPGALPEHVGAPGRRFKAIKRLARKSSRKE